MKNTIKLIAAAVITVVFTFSAQAQNFGSENFHVTNRVDATVTIASPPTFTWGGTEALSTNTGNYISVVNESELGIEVRGTFISTNTTDLLIVTMVGASVNGTPSSTDFEEDYVASGSSQWKFAVPYCTTGTPAAPVTNTIVWHTNFPTLFLRRLSHVGVGAITNSALPGVGLPNSANTNLNIRAIKKHILLGS